MSSWTTFFQLIRRDLIAFKRGFRKKFIDTAILFFTNVMAFGYFLQQEGAHEGYAAFFVVGAIASFGFVEIVGKVGVQLADMGGDRTIFHTLVMPIRSNMVFLLYGTFLGNHFCPPFNSIISSWKALSFYRVEPRYSLLVEVGDPVYLSKSILWLLCSLVD